MTNIKKKKIEMCENIEDTLSEYEKEILDHIFGLCSSCNQPNTSYRWYQNCSSKIFQ